MMPGALDVTSCNTSDEYGLAPTTRMSFLASRRTRASRRSRFSARRNTSAVRFELIHAPTVFLCCSPDLCSDYTLTRPNCNRQEVRTQLPFGSCFREVIIAEGNAMGRTRKDLSATSGNARFLVRSNTRVNCGKDNEHRCS